MQLDDWEEVSKKDDENEAEGVDDLDYLDPTPAYEESIPGSHSASKPDNDTDTGPARLRILGATWGGVNVTAEIAAMVNPDDQTLPINTHTIFRTLRPDPAIGSNKILTVLYQYSNEDELRVLNVPEYIPFVHADITPTAHRNEGSLLGLKPNYFTTLEQGWRDGFDNKVEILAVLYGPSRIQNPLVMQELVTFFEGKRGQIRMTNGFFGTDPWPGKRKTWTVFFRFLDSKSKRVQVVTGWEDGALEVPWSRD